MASVAAASRFCGACTSRHPSCRDDIRPGNRPADEADADSMGLGRHVCGVTLAGVVRRWLSQWRTRLVNLEKPRSWSSRRGILVARGKAGFEVLTVRSEDAKPGFPCGPLRKLLRVDVAAHSSAGVSHRQADRKQLLASRERSATGTAQGAASPVQCRPSSPPPSPRTTPTPPKRSGAKWPNRFASSCCCKICKRCKNSERRGWRRGWDSNPR